MASDYYDKDTNDKQVSDGDTCYADDLNKVNNATNAGFEMVESEVDDATTAAVENAGLSKEWAANAQGDLPSNPSGDPPNTDKYSSKANAIETEDWASADDGSFDPGDTINLAAGGTEIHPSAKTSADHAETQADLAEAAKVIAVNAKDSAIAQNSIVGGTNINVTSVGTPPDPIEFTVNMDGGFLLDSREVNAGDGLTGGGDLTEDRTISHADNSSANDISYSSGYALTSLDVDSFGHILSTPSKQRMSLYGHTHSYLPLSGGTLTGYLYFGDGNTYQSWDTATHYFRSATKHIVLETQQEGRFITLKSSSSGAGGQVRLQSGSGGAVGTTLVLNDYSAVIQLRTFGEGVDLDPTAFHSTVDSNGSTGHTLGDGTHKWLNVHAANGVIQTSDERRKDFYGLGDCSWIYDLKPLGFSWKGDLDKIHRTGFSAQDTYSKIPEKNSSLIHKPENEDVEDWGMSSEQLIAPMVKLLQDQKKLIDSLTERLEILEAK